MKRIIILFPILILMLSVASCDTGEDSASSYIRSTSPVRTETPVAVIDKTPFPTPVYNYLSDISQSDIDKMSEAERVIFQSDVIIAIAKKEKGGGEKVDVPLGGENRIVLSDLPLERLEWINSYISDLRSLPEVDDSISFDITVYEENFKTEGRARFCLYETVQELSRSLEWYVTQIENPELSFDVSSQTLEYAYFYLDYYADCSAEEAKGTLEGYTDTMIQAIRYACPNVKADLLVFFWKIPAVDEDSLYAATYFCESMNGVITRGEGSGLIY